RAADERAEADEALEDEEFEVVGDDGKVHRLTRPVAPSRTGVRCLAASLAPGWPACTPSLARTPRARPPIPQGGLHGGQSIVGGALAASCASRGDTAGHTVHATPPCTASRVERYGGAH